MIVMDKDERNREIEKRERLIQTYLIISSFLIAFFSRDLLGKLQNYFVLLFTLIVTMAILYNIFVSRTKIYYLVDFFGLIFSALFTGFLTLIFALYTGEKIGIIPFFTYSAIFTFSLLSPETNEKYDIWVETYIISYLRKHLANKNPTHVYIILIFIGIITLVFAWYKII
jgi:hypothetical protein